MKTQSLHIQSPRIFRPIESTQNQLYNEPNQPNWSLIKKHHKLRMNSIDFIIKSCNKYQFKKDTLFLAIKILDILIKQSFQSFFDDCQLLAATLIILVTKYNQVYPVTIDQINLITQKYYSRQSIHHIEGLVLECLNFQIPQFTVYSELFNQLHHTFGKYSTSDSDKQNQTDHHNLPPKPNQKSNKHDQHGLVSKTLKAIKQPQCFKYGEEFLINGLLSYLKNQKHRGSSVHIVKTNYIRTVIKKSIEPQKSNQQNQRKPSVPKYLSPRQMKLNPQKKLLRKQKIFVF